MEFRNFALNQRKNVPSRLQILQNEIQSVGQIRVIYARTNPDWVLTFVKNTALMPLSKREALKHLKH